MENQLIRILLVEYASEDAQWVEHCLWEVRERQFRLVRVEGLEAMDERLQTGDFDVLLLDLNLPNSRGIATLSRAMALAPWIPIVVLISEDEEIRGIEAVRFGAQDYVVKGEYDGWALVRILGNAIERTRTRRDA